MEKRFQDCNKLEQLYRYRWYLLIPFQWLNTRVRYAISRNKTDGGIYTGHGLWSLLIGSAQIKMKWYYTSEEVFAKINERRKISDENQRNKRRW